MDYPRPDRTPLGRLRDKVAHRVANFALRHIATPWYRAMIDGSIRVGLTMAAGERSRAAGASAASPHDSARAAAAWMDNTSLDPMTLVILGDALADTMHELEEQLATALARIDRAKTIANEDLNIRVFQALTSSE